ncbi:hypothetical protein TSAR_004027 [Trichomalopsis sarcophagae]|uniref:Uncharacterized protein n=1 Tax=Trichomalopsis sarcophagae TaxID=543379 RepID=A0A232EXB7_9HYME|nr:hypothetical protein TSAR_004027 [Trichomalopsis sarcophagae]
MCERNQNRNYLKELRGLIHQIRSIQLEPEVCNVTCPPLGCPRGPCPGLCRDERGCPDPCCLSKMPGDCSPPPNPRRHRINRNPCCGHAH